VTPGASVAGAAVPADRSADADPSAGATGSRGAARTRGADLSTGAGRRESAPAGSGPPPVAATRRERSEPGHAARARRRFKDEAALLVLTTGGPEEVLARLGDGDPLRLWARLVRRAAGRALLVPPALLFARGAAHCARRAQEYRGRPRPDLWLERRSEEVVRGFERVADRLASVGGRRSPSDARLSSAAARFNACPRRDRETLWRLAFAGATLDEVARDARSSLSDVARRARRALDALLAGEATAVRGRAPHLTHGGSPRGPASPPPHGSVPSHGPVPKDGPVPKHESIAMHEPGPMHGSRPSTPTAAQDVQTASARPDAAPAAGERATREEVPS
jgi:hypothetical protein